MSRLIVLSNRVMMPDNGPMAGGLALALHNVLQGDAVIWMGWNGKVEGGSDNDNGSDSDYVNSFNSSDQQVVADPYNSKTRLTRITTALKKPQYRQFYCGFANNVLWPLLHERADLISQSAEDYEGYQKVNQLYAKQLKQIIQPNDVIWVHDYHFLSVAYHCRKLSINNRIGFFLHIPFAPLSFWQTLKQSRESVKHLAHYDVIGTQTQQDKANCFTVIQHYLTDSILASSESNTHSVGLDKSEPNTNPSQRQTRLLLTLNLDFCTSHDLVVDAYPIGVDVAYVQKQVSHLSSSSQKSNNIKPHSQKIIAVDRIDYSKGLLERISAYRHFLQQNPQYQNQLELLQIACPSRLDLPIYQHLYKQVRQSVDEMNQQFLTDSNHCKCADKHHENTLKVGEFKLNTCTSPSPWQPVSYSEEVLSHKRLMAVFWHIVNLF